LLEPVGLVTCAGPLARLPLRRFDEIVLGGHEITRGDLSRSVRELVSHGILDRDLVGAAARDAALYDERIRPGLLDEADVGSGDLHPAALRKSGESPRAQVEALREDIEAFREAHALERVVVCCLSSTETWREPPEEGRDLASLERGLDDGASFPASCLYAYAALRAGAPFVNFTPNTGSSLPGLGDLARELGLPHCGNDGKTGETLLKTVLAPMFTARALKVHSWQGYNMLGNRDGENLSDPLHRESKLRSKDDALRSLLESFPFASVTLIGRDRPGVLFRAAATIPAQSALLDRVDTVFGLSGPAVARYDDAARGIGRRVRVDADRLAAVRLSAERVEAVPHAGHQHRDVLRLLEVAEHLHGTPLAVGVHRVELPRPLHLDDVAVGIQLGHRDRGEQLLDRRQPLLVRIGRGLGVDRTLQTVAGGDEQGMIRTEPLGKLVGLSHRDSP